jgi:hypothetical protein
MRAHRSRETKISTIPLASVTGVFRWPWPGNLKWRVQLSTSGYCSTISCQNISFFRTKTLDR